MMDGGNNNCNNYLVTTEVKGILQLYDENDLLRTIPNNYKVDSSTLKSYAKRCKPTQSVELNLTESHINFLTALAENNNIPLSLLFNFLIETVANCGKINTKNIKQALDCYYYAVAHDKTLFSRILEGYSNSGFYYTEKTKTTPNPGLNEEGVACFLTLSEEREKYNTRI